MSTSELAHLELLAEVDSLLAELRRWAEQAPAWPPARACQALVHRLAERADTLRVRLEAPLVVATLGGTGTGKSALVNALCGADVTAAGRQRPTTLKPMLICRRELAPEALGIDPGEVEVVVRDLPALRDLVLLDCPDPDTTEDTLAPDGTNLARLRALLPHCDVLLVTATQQKYRSARVQDELAAAAPGARLVFVQTHADLDDDIRADWARALGDQYSPGEMFFVDSLAALADAQSAAPPKGEFARLVDYLARELAGTAANRVRRANFVDLVQATLEACRGRIDEALPAVEQLETAIVEQRSRLAAKLAVRMRDELLGSRRPWESRLVGEIASRWGFSPFSLVLRGFQGAGSLLAGATLLRIRTPAQLALWGALEGGRRIRRHTTSRQADQALDRALAFSWDESDLRTAAIIIDGYAAEAQLGRGPSDWRHVARQAQDAGRAFLEQAAAQLQGLVVELAGRHTGRLTRFCYELALAALLGLLLYRLGRNFFYDSWLAPGPPQPLFDMSFFFYAVFWLLLWSLLLLWSFTSRLRRGLQARIDDLAQRWAGPTAAAGVFADLEQQCRAIRRFRDGLEQLETRVGQIKRRVEAGLSRLGHRLGHPRGAA